MEDGWVSVRLAPIFLAKEEKLIVATAAVTPTSTPARKGRIADRLLAFDVKLNGTIVR